MKRGNLTAGVIYLLIATHSLQVILLTSSMSDSKTCQYHQIMFSLNHFGCGPVRVGERKDFQSNKQGSSEVSLALTPSDTFVFRLHDFAQGHSLALPKNGFWDWFDLPTLHRIVSTKNTCLFWTLLMNKIQMIYLTYLILPRVAPVPICHGVASWPVSAFLFPWPHFFDWRQHSIFSSLLKTTI